MEHDFLKCFTLSEAQPRKAFRLNAEHAPQIKDKENAQPVIPPPRTVFNPHPRLAPPGMMGSRLSADAAKWMDAKRQERADERPFKPFSHKPDKGRGWER